MTKRPIYLVSVTPSGEKGIIDLPFLATKWLHPTISLEQVDGIIFTSKKGVEALERIAPEWKRLPVLCVGVATRKQAEELGGKVLAAGNGYGDNVYELIHDRFKTLRWLYARPGVIASDFAERLRREGTVVEEAVVYETVCQADTLQTPPIETNAVLIFTSPSAVHCFQSRFNFHPDQHIVVIGRTTEKSLPNIPVHVAPEPTVASCIALAKKLAKEKS